MHSFNICTFIQYLYIHSIFVYIFVRTFNIYIYIYIFVHAFNIFVPTFNIFSIMIKQHIHSKVLPYFGNRRHSSAASVTFAKVVKVMNHTGL